MAGPWRHCAVKLVRITDAIALLYSPACNNGPPSVVQFTALLSRRSDHVLWNATQRLAHHVSDCRLLGRIRQGSMSVCFFLDRFAMPPIGMYPLWPRMAHDNHLRTEPRVVLRHVPSTNTGAFFECIKGSEHRA